MFYVYLYTHNDRPLYVGKGQRNRYLDHLRQSQRAPARHHTNLAKYLRKHDLSGLRISTIPCDTEAAAHKLEADLILAIGRRDLKTGPLINLTEGGDRGFTGKHTAETKAKMSAWQKGRPKHTEERKQQISAKLKGRVFSDEHRRNLSLAARNRKPRT